MAILTDMPNELLLSIIVDVSPLYIESFALSCKRIYYLCTDTLRDHDLVRSRLANLDETELSRAIISNPRMALYPKLAKISPRDSCWSKWAPEDLVVDMDAQNLQSPYAKVLSSINTTYGHTVVPLLITCLLNVRKLAINVEYSDDLLELFPQVVEDIHEPSLTLGGPRALGRLTEVHISNNLRLAILLATIPSVRKLRIDVMSEWSRYTREDQQRRSCATEVILGGCVDMDFLEDLIRRTEALQKFTYNHRIHKRGAKLEPRSLVEILKQRARQSLTYLSLLAEKSPYPRSLYDIYHPSRNHKDLSLGSLREFTVLKTLVAFVDVFIKTRNHGEDKNGWCTTGTGTVQRLVSWLPASLETLVLHQGLEKWSKDDLRMLFRGFRNNKQARLPNLRFLILVQCPDFEDLMPDDVKSTCQETGMKIGYTSHVCKTLEDLRIHEQLGNWESYLGQLGNPS